MEINCTLLVQGLNFGIAYIILSRLIFKPILETVFEEQAKKEALQEAIVASQLAIENLQVKQADDWKYAQKQFAHSISNIAYEPPVMACSYVYEYELASYAQIDEKAKQIHDLVMKEVVHEFK